MHVGRIVNDLCFSPDNVFSIRCIYRNTDSTTGKYCSVKLWNTAYFIFISKEVGQSHGNTVE